MINFLYEINGLVSGGEGDGLKCFPLPVYLSTYLSSTDPPRGFSYVYGLTTIHILPPFLFTYVYVIVIYQLGLYKIE